MKKREQLEKNLAEWIDTKNIANYIVEALGANDLELTLENGQKVWEDFCYELSDQMDYCAEAIADKRRENTELDL